MSLHDKIRVMLDWNDNGVFDEPVSLPNLPQNLIKDARRMRASFHRIIGSAHFYQQNFWANPFIIAARDFTTYAAGATLPRLQTYTTSEFESRYVLRVNMDDQGSAFWFRTWRDWAASACPCLRP